MRVIEIEVLNFKGVSTVRFQPTGAVTPIVGKNGAGKSSCLDGVAAALGGAALCPEMPIRKGQSKARVSVKLQSTATPGEKYLVTRTWTPKASTLEVTNADGAVYKSPQAFLNKLVGELFFDPLHFSLMKPAEQAATLARVAGIDLDAHRAKRAALFAERTAANKSAKELRAQVAGVPPFGPEVPDEEVSTAAILEEVVAAEHARKRREAAEREHTAAVTRHATAARRVEELKRELLEAEKDVLTFLEDVGACRTALEGCPLPPDVEAIRARGRDAEALNRKVAAKRARATKEDEAVAQEAKSSEITQKIERLDLDQAERLKATALPVPGLSIDESGVTVNGIPFAQCSSAEQLRVSVAIDLALNPNLKLMLIRNGNQLDADGMRLLAGLAEEAGAQVLIERVSDGEGVGIRIVDGTTEGVQQAA